MHICMTRDNLRKHEISYTTIRQYLYPPKLKSWLRPWSHWLHVEAFVVALRFARSAAPCFWCLWCFWCKNSWCFPAIPFVDHSHLAWHVSYVKHSRLTVANNSTHSPLVLFTFSRWRHQSFASCFGPVIFLYWSHDRTTVSDLLWNFHDDFTQSCNKTNTGNQNSSLPAVAATM